MSENTKTFDHTEEKTYKACGWNEEELEALTKKVNRMNMASEKRSQFVERMVNELKKDELAILIMILSDQLTEVKSNLLSIIRSMMESMEETEEEQS